MRQTAVDLAERVRRFLSDELWRREREAGAMGWLVRLVQLGVVTAEGFVRDRLLLRASALTYLLVLSLIPLIALALGVAEAVGVRENLTELVVAAVTAGAPGAEDFLRDRVMSVNFASLGTLGAAALLITTVLFIGNVEEALNNIWGVQHRRPWVRRFPDYLAVLLLGPILLGVAISLGTTLQSQTLVERLLAEPLFAAAYRMGLRFVPMGIAVLGLAALYWFLPNTEVRPVSALLGGAVAGAGIVLAQDAYVDLSVGVTRYNALFGGLAFLPLLLVSIYLSCAVMLFGAEVAFAHQNLPHYRREVRGRPVGAAAREAVGLRVSLEVARAFRDGAPPFTSDALSDQLDVPVRTVRDVLADLEDARIVSRRTSDEREISFQLARPAERIPVLAVLDALRGAREFVAVPGPITEPARELLRELDEGVAKAAAGRTLADALERVPPPAPAGPATVDPSEGGG